MLCYHLTTKILAEELFDKFALSNPNPHPKESDIDNDNNDVDVDDAE